MKIFTYHTTIPEINVSEEARLIKLWAERWAALGFEPFCLTEWFASQHPLYNEYVQKIKSVHSPNPAGYDWACFMRWLAMANAPGVTRNDLCLMSDADVIGYDKTPFLFYGTRLKKTFIPVSFQMHIPCLVLGNKDHFAAQAQRFMDFIDSPNYKPAYHTSDMYMLETQFGLYPEHIVSLHTVKSYGEDGWQQAPAVHYCHAAMIPAKLTPRYKHIPTMR